MLKSVHAPAAVILSAIFLFALGGAVTAAPKAKLIPRWEAHNPASKVQVDHTAFDQFLKSFRYIGEDGIARLHYDQVEEADKEALGEYIEMLEGVKVRNLNRDEQYAFWVNLYNAGTIQLILDHYPVVSIREVNISPGFFSIGPWGAPLFQVEGAELSLNDIEHGILRPIWNDPRTHYVVNCASLGCPDIPLVALTATNSEQIRKAAARAYINHPRGVQITNGGDVYLSSIFSWFSEDFGSNDAEILDHIRKFASPSLLAELKDATEVEGYRYDWKLNGEGGELAPKNQP